MNLFTAIETITKKRKRLCCEHLGDISNLNKLREMTFRLGTKHGGSIPYYGKNGIEDRVIELTVYEQSNIEILYVSAKKDTLFPEHIHNKASEILLISKGKLLVEMGPMTSMCKTGQFIHLELGQLHKVKVLEDSIVIVVFIKILNGAENVRN